MNQNKILLEYEGDINLMKVTEIKVYIKQKHLFLEKVPTVLSEKSAYITIEFDEAKRLQVNDPARMQTVYTDGNGTPMATDIENVTVDELLKVEGYNGD